MADFESLVIGSRSKLAGKPQEWAPLGNMATFTKEIITPTMAKGADMSAVVSGIPTIFARINLFTNAISYIQDTRGAENAKNDGLMKFYVDLVSEWRGFLACLAFDYKNIRVDRIELAYSDGADITETNNIYEPKGAFGNMLFERKPLWCTQSQDGNKKQVPFIDVIRYKDNIVAATSPDSLFFTSAAYTINEDKPFVNAETGRFMDPIGVVDLSTLIPSYSTQNMSVNGTNYALYTSASSLPTIIAPTAYAGTGGYILATNTNKNGLEWVAKPTSNVSTSAVVSSSASGTTQITAA